MPIWLRNYTFNLLEQHYTNKPESDSNEPSATTEIQIPDFITKAPKK